MNKEYLCFTAKEDTVITRAVSNDKPNVSVLSDDVYSLFYSFDKINWKRMDANRSFHTTLNLHKGDKVYFFGQGTIYNGTGICSFIIGNKNENSGYCDISGNILSLWNFQYPWLNPSSGIGEYNTFSYMFSNCVIDDCSKLIIPKTTSHDLFKGMFSDSTIKKAPYILFKAFAQKTDAACQAMFYNCNNLEYLVFQTIHNIYVPGVLSIGQNNIANWLPAKSASDPVCTVVLHPDTVLPEGTSGIPSNGYVVERRIW